MKRALATATRGFTGWCVRRFYRIQPLGRTLPASGPLLVVANHPNGLMDPLVLAESSRRPLRWLGKEPLLRMPVVGLFARALEMLPVYRAQDGADTSANARTFAAVSAALRAGSAVALFPEGKSHSRPGLEKLKTGAARMALAAESEASFQLDLAIAPVGLVYRDKASFQSSVAVWIGDPLYPGRDHTWVELARRDPWAAVEELHARITAALERVSLDLERWEDLPLLELAERVWRRESESGDASRVAARLTRLRNLARGLRRLRQRDPQRAQLLVEQALRLEEKFERSGWTARELARSPSTRANWRWGAREVAALCAGALPASCGGLLWFVPYQLVRWSVRWGPQELDLRATAKLLAALLWYPLTWAGWIALGWSASGPALAASVACAAPALGVFALEYARGRWNAWARLRALLRGLRRQALRERLRARARRLAEEIERIAEQQR